MKIIYTIITVLVCYGIVPAAETDTLPLLQLYLGSTIEVVSEQEIRYCPDNTCEIFRIEEPDKIDILASFVYLYLYHKSDYVYLDNSFDDTVPFRIIATSEEASIRKQVARYCLEPVKSPHCILEYMKKNLGITISFGRYDEGRFSGS